MRNINQEYTVYIVKTSVARMPLSCWGKYRRVAVLEVSPGVTDVAMISARAKGVIRVVRVWERCHVGTTARCAFALCLEAARELANRLNMGVTTYPRISIRELTDVEEARRSAETVADACGSCLEAEVAAIHRMAREELDGDILDVIDGGTPTREYWWAIRAETDRANDEHRADYGL